MVRTPIPATKRRCTCGCNTTSTKTMNTHMRQHSRRLNIKTTRLASLTAVFRPKKRAPSTVDANITTAMDVDESLYPPGQDDVARGSEGIPQGTAISSGGNEMDDDSSEGDETGDDGVDGDEADDDGSDDSDMSVEGVLADVDSEDEFESDEESVSGIEEAEVGQAPLEFELRAAEAGSVLHRVWP